MPEEAVRAVVFDLDDTLFDQHSWLAGAWRGVAAVGPAYGVESDLLLEALEVTAAGGTDKGRIIDRALSEIGAASCPVAPFVEAFRSFRSPPLHPFPGVAESLRRLRRSVPIALVTDGDPDLQRDKLSAIGLEEAFDVVVVTDELGRERRKPDPAGYLAALAHLAVVPEEAVAIGDRPSKDSAAGRSAGMRVVRVLTGEYRDAADEPPAWAVASDCVAAIELIEPLLAEARRERDRAN